MAKKKFNLIDFLFPKWLFPYKFNMGDERIPKLLGLVLILFSAYIAVAFTSYIFTWDKDQSEVLANDWGILFNTQANMANWLGRLGAIVSHTFIYGGFGLPAFAFSFLFFTTGLALMRKQSIRTQYPIYFFALLAMMLGATLLSFIFNVGIDGGFPWGGAVGDGICAWLVAMIGKTGMLLLIIFTLIGSTLWIFNPTMDDFSWAQIKKDFQLRFGNFLPRSNDDEDEAETTPTTRRTPARRTPTADAQADAQNNAADDEEDAPATPINTPFNPLRPSATTPVRPITLPEDEGANEVNLRTGQIQIPLPNSSNTPPRRPSLRGAGDDMEIIIPEGEDLVEDEEIVTRTLTRAEGGERIGDIEDEDYSAMTPYDPTLDLASYEHPVVALLENYDDQKIEIDRAELEANKDQIIETLLNYKIEITKIKATIGPTVTLYEIVPAPGVRISKIKSLEDDVALNLAALGIRIIAPIPGRGTIGIEVPNKNKQIVSLKEVLMSEKFKRAAMDLPIALGKTISNEVFVADLAKMPHLLIAGATGQGKSVGINTILMSILYKKHPSHVKLVLIDPKKVELSPYNKIEHHFLAFLPGQDEPIITETQKVIHTLNSLCMEMDQRYDLLKKAECRNLREYNAKFTARRLSPKKGHKFLPYIILVIDEFADMIMTAGKEVEQPIGRLAQLARAVGIHLIIATQRPSVNIITGVIKANFPVRLAFKVSSKIDSRTILDSGGADQLIGRGDMLLSIEGEMIRLQCAFVDTPEVERVIDYIGSQRGFPEPYYLPEVGSDAAGADADDFNFGPDEWDEFFEDAARTLVQTQQGSTSMIQRRLKLGYNRAGRIMDQLEAAGIVGPNEGSKAREVLIADEAELDRYLAQLKKKR
jgi:DNA segregation ATPase FtsK/SpoIIIE, S-DNA-T family